MIRYTIPIYSAIGFLTGLCVGYNNPEENNLSSLETIAICAPMAISSTLTPLTIKLSKVINQFMINKFNMGLETGEFKSKNKYLRDLEPKEKQELGEKIKGYIEKLEESRENYPPYFGTTIANISSSASGTFSGFYLGKLLRTIF